MWKPVRQAQIVAPGIDGDDIVVLPHIRVTSPVGLRSMPGQNRSGLSEMKQSWNALAGFLSVQMRMFHVPDVITG